MDIIKANVSNVISIENPTAEALMWCKKNLTVPNPDFSKKARMHLWLGDTPKVLTLYEQRGDTLVLPFGTLRSLPDSVKSEAVFISDFADPVKVSYNANVPLYDYQETAVQAMVTAQ